MHLHESYLLVNATDKFDSAINHLIHNLYVYLFNVLMKDKSYLYFCFVVVGLKGNPLSQELQQIYGEPNGTVNLLTYMLDHLHSEYLHLTQLLVYTYSECTVFFAGQIIGSDVCILLLLLCFSLSVVEIFVMIICYCPE